MSKEIDDQQLGAFLHALTQSTVCIVGKDSAGEFGTMIGTGTLVEVGEEKHILTANHVVEACTNEELRFFLPDDTAVLAEPPMPTRVDMAGVRLWQPLDIESRLEDEDLDIALLRLRTAEAVPSFCHFRQIRRTPHPPTDRFQFVMMGYPAQRAGRLPSGNRVAFRNVDYPELVDLSGRTFKGFDPKIHFLTDFPSSDDFHPGGYSGSGLWLGQIGDQDIWRPDPRYCGMQVGYYERTKLLKILGVNSILDFIEGRR